MERRCGLCAVAREAILDRIVRRQIRCCSPNDANRLGPREVIPGLHAEINQSAHRWEVRAGSMLVEECERFQHGAGWLLGAGQLWTVRLQASAQLFGNTLRDSRHEREQALVCKERQGLPVAEKRELLYLVASLLEVLGASELTGPHSIVGQVVAYAPQIGILPDKHSNRSHPSRKKLGNGPLQACQCAVHSASRLVVRDHDCLRAGGRGAGASQAFSKRQEPCSVFRGGSPAMGRGQSVLRLAVSPMSAQAFNVGPAIAVNELHVVSKDHESASAKMADDGVLKRRRVLMLVGDDNRVALGES